MSLILSDEIERQVDLFFESLDNIGGGVPFEAEVDGTIVSLNDLEDAFIEADSDHSGMLSADEIASTLVKLGISQDLAQVYCEDFFSLADPYGTGEVPFEEFAAEYLRMQSFKSLQRGCVEFKKLDTDQDHGLDKQELYPMVRDFLGEQAAEQQLDLVFDEMDLDGSGQVSLREYVRWYFHNANQIGSDRQGRIGKTAPLVYYNGNKTCIRSGTKFYAPSIKFRTAKYPSSVDIKQSFSSSQGSWGPSHANGQEMIENPETRSYFGGGVSIDAYLQIELVLSEQNEQAQVEECEEEYAGEEEQEEAELTKEAKSSLGQVLLEWDYTKRAIEYSLIFATDSACENIIHQVTIDEKEFPDNNFEDKGDGNHTVSIDPGLIKVFSSPSSSSSSSSSSSCFMRLVIHRLADEVKDFHLKSVRSLSSRERIPTVADRQMTAPETRQYACFRTTYVHQEYATRQDYSWEGDWHPSQDHPTRFVQYDAIWWDSSDYSGIHIYQFYQHQQEQLSKCFFDPSSSELSLAELREQFCVYSAQVPPVDKDDAKGISNQQNIIANALTKAFGVLIQEHPAKYYVVAPTGHGGATAGFFESRLSTDTTRQVLSNFYQLLGRRKIDILDFYGPCSQSTLTLLANYCDYGRWMIASQHTVGQASWNNPDPNSSDENKVKLLADAEGMDDLFYGTFAPNDYTYEWSTQTPINVLRLLAEAKDFQYAHPGFIDMCQHKTKPNEIMQSMSLFDCAKFNPFFAELKRFRSQLTPKLLAEAKYDLREAIQSSQIPGPDKAHLDLLWNQLVVSFSSNQDFLDWPYAQHGVNVYDISFFDDSKTQQVRDIKMSLANMPAEQAIEYVERIAQEGDQNKDGLISITELVVGFQKVEGIGFQKANRRVNQLLDQVDLHFDDKGCVSLDLLLAKISATYEPGQ